MAGIGAAPVSFMGANPALIRQALMMQGHDPSFMDEVSREPPTAAAAPPAPITTPAPAPTAANPIDQALQTVGSSYRLPREEPPAVPAARAPAAASSTPSTTSTPAMAPAPPAPSSPAAPAGTAQAPAPTISGTAFNPNASTRQLRNEVVGGINEAMGLKTEQGEIGARKAERQAEQFGQLSQEQREGLNDAKAALEENRRRRARLEKSSDEALDAMSEAIKHPPDTTKGRALSIVASVVGMFPGGGGIAGGLQSMRQAMAEDMQAYQAKISNNADAAKTFAAMAGAEDDESESRLRQQQLIGTMTAATYDSALKQIEKEAESEEARRAAQELRLGVRQTAAEGAIRANEQRAAAAAAQARKGAMSEQDTAIVRAIAGAPTPEAAKAIAAQFGEHGLELLGKVQRGDKTQAEIAESQADAAKKTREANAPPEGGPGVEVVPGFIDTIGLDKPTVTELRRNAQTYASIEEQYAQLRAIRERNKGGTWNTTDQSDAARIMGSMIGQFSQMSGAGAPSESEREDFKNTLTDPTGFYAFKNPTAIYDTAIAGLKKGFASKLAAVGVKPREGGAEQAADIPTQAGFSQKADTQAAARRAVSQQGRVPMVNLKTGEVRPAVRPDLVKQYEGLGFTVNAIPGEAPAPEAQPQSAAPAGPRWPGAMGG